MITPAHFRSLADRESVVQSICDALNEGDVSHAGWLLNFALKLVPAYDAADALEATVTRLATTPLMPCASSLPPGEARLGGRDWPLMLPAPTQEQELQRIVDAARNA